MDQDKYNSIQTVSWSMLNTPEQITVIEKYFSTFSPEQLQRELSETPKIKYFYRRLQTAKSLISK